ncbi:hypothetical protein ROZALSC1DRAFT_26872 [Rozella allomycis CSF55]|uniref:Uncharacterized protein n=1 Tax=Rozella allomycis (strain CSF55) TaxID=988480 RepID=A0A075ARY1_ROZAC|nr:hypothetical protein O9G_000943 [Rozella allomycis CSF55]RKP21730.1 hypothetical protein ROZALSC1DRAFT_26872 [Rozella allomycis CSF55]|eukprot:EPZ31298.1 hypothetical protein O9G_000943 [Rozella allomycis CSF55]
MVKEPLFGSSFYKANLRTDPNGGLMSPCTMKVLFKDSSVYTFSDIVKSERFKAEQENLFVPLPDEPLPAYTKSDDSFDSITPPLYDH